MPERSPVDAWLRELQSGPLCSFANLAGAGLPRVAAGVYTVWQGPLFVYVGMAGRASTVAALAAHEAAAGKEKGLAQRIRSHASGRRSGDQFCIYIADRFVLPTLSTDEIRLVAAGTLSIDDRTRDYTRSELRFRWVRVPSGADAHALERRIQKSGFAGVRPLLNPLGGR